MYSVYLYCMPLNSIQIVGQ